jgi:plasmid stability protein
MADVKVRQLPDWVLETHRSRARAAGRSLEEQLRCLLTQAALDAQTEFAVEVVAFREGLQARYGLLPDSTPGIVQDREQRG